VLRACHKRHRALSRVLAIVDCRRSNDPYLLGESVAAIANGENGDACARCQAGSGALVAVNTAERSDARWSLLALALGARWRHFAFAAPESFAAPNADRPSVMF
jgi:hypothetical protein